MKCSFLRRGRIAASIAVGAGAIALAASLPAAAATSAPSQPARPAAAAWGRAVVLVNCQHHGVVLPRSFVLACADGNDFLSNLSWVSWRGVAYGSGIEHLNSCVPNCGKGHFHSYPVLITAWRAKWRGHHINQLHFTRLTLIYTHRRPVRFTAHGKTHHPQTYTYHL
jgi:hypothetical protein